MFDFSNHIKRKFTESKEINIFDNVWLRISCMCFLITPQYFVVFMRKIWEAD